MRKLILPVLTFVLVTGIASASAGEPATVAAINAASAALDDAFERQSAEDIKRMMTADHIAVTPYYKTPQTAGPADRVAA